MTRLVVRAEPWMRQAACRGMAPERFFPERGDNTGPAKAICGECPVQRECGEFGLFEKHGIWGGHSERERRRRRKAPA